MASKDQGPCFIVIGILMIVAGWLWLWPLFIMGLVFVFCGICSSQQKAKRTTASQTPSYQPQPAVQQTAPAAPAPAPPQPAIVTEKAKFCPHCGSPASDNFCSACGSKID